jgi:sarcosine oxidase
VRLETASGAFTCRKLVIAAGSWTDQLLAGLGTNLGLTVTQEQVTYFATPNVRDFVIGKFPFFMWHGDEMFYAFPIWGEVATKIGIDAVGPVVTAETRTFDYDEAREQRVEAFLQEYLAGFLGPRLMTKTCLYDMTRDRNLVIDALLDCPQVLVCCGAGHGYKFAAVLGKALSELALDGQTGYPIAPFTARRPAITDPDYPPSFRL